MPRFPFFAVGASFTGWEKRDDGTSTTSGITESSNSLASIRREGVRDLTSSLSTPTNYLEGFTASCYNARTIRKGSLKYCYMVSWASAAVFNSSTFDVYNPGTPLSNSAQDAIAFYIAQDILGSDQSQLENACVDSAQLFACVTAFPFCPIVGSSASSASYFPPCKLQCTQVNAICGPDTGLTQRGVSVDCSGYQSEKSCMFAVPTGRYLLDPNQVGSWIYNG